jgi:Asp/Glu/hydantoin racemase
VNADSEPPSDPGATRAPGELERSAARCRAVAHQIRDSLLQDLAAEALSLGAAALSDVADAEREALQARARTIGRCAHLLEAAAGRLESMAE